MNRNHLFKAKRVDWRSLPKEKWWVEGDLIHEPYGTTIRYCAKANKKKYTKMVAVVVDPETVCECTFTADKNNKNIYEADIVKRESFGGNVVGKVVWFDIGFCGFMLKCGNTYYHIGKGEHTGRADGDEIIGNIFDNPELLKEEK